MPDNDLDATQPPRASTGRRLSRRSLGAALATPVLGGAAELADPLEAHAATDAVLHLLRRSTYGPTPALLAEVRKVGPAAWLKAQLRPASVPDPTMAALLPRWPGRDWSTEEVRTLLPRSQQWDFMYGITERHLASAIWSRRQLLEVVVDFWSNHLVVPVPNSDVYDCAHLYQRDVIRTHALGRYVDLLHAAVRHPALLRVLDNASSTKTAPNENHARELLELHTVGVGSFTEADVKAAALVLTGLGVDPTTGAFAYQARQHHVGPVRVLGWSSPNATAEGGEAVALSLLSYLARHPLTARHLARKLAVRFVSDSPPSALVERLASTYLSNGTAIVPVLEHLFTSAEFARSAGQKVRTPYEDVVATLRIAGVKPEASGTSGLHDLIWLLTGMGQLPLAWPAPDGYPDVAERWASTSGTLRRWNFHLGVTGGWAVKQFPRPPASALFRTRPVTYGAYVDALAHRLLLSPVTAAQRRALCAYLLHQPGDALGPQDAALTWRLPFVAALVLDTPNFVLR